MNVAPVVLHLKALLYSDIQCIDIQYIPPIRVCTPSTDYVRAIKPVIVMPISHTISSNANLSTNVLHCFSTEEETAARLLDFEKYPACTR